MKRGPLSKAEKFYIDNNRTMGIDQLVIDLDRAQNQIEKYLKETENAKKNVKETLMRKTMGRHERNGKPVATVMTPAASELADDQRAMLNSKKKNQEAIYRPFQ